MNFLFKKGLIWVCVAVIYDGRVTTVENCVVDTGSATTAIDIDQIELNYSRPAKIRRLFGVGDGTQDVIVQNVDAFRIGVHNFKDVELEFGDLKGRFGIGGFIGNDILSRCNVNIDYTNQNLNLKSVTS